MAAQAEKAMSDAHLEMIKERLANATPGPWYWRADNSPEEECLVADEGAMQVLSPMASVGRGGYGGYLHGDMLEEDKELIAKAPTDLARLVAEVERLRQAIEDIRAEHAKEFREMERDFQREARDIAAEAFFNATSDDPYGTY